MKCINKSAPHKSGRLDKGHWLVYADKNLSSNNDHVNNNFLNELPFYLFLLLVET